MFRLSNRLHRAGIAALLGLGVALAADAQPTPGRAAPDLEARLDRLTQDLTLTDAQQAGLEALAARYADADRARLWDATADLADLLSDAQIDQLQAAAQARQGERGDRVRGRRGGRGERGARGDRGPRGARAERVQLSDEQREALREIRTDVRERTAALAEQLREGQISDEAFEARVREVRDDGMRRSAELLPEEAAQRLSERQAAREASADARERVLGLTDAQQDRLRALRLDRVREHQPIDVRPYLEDDGSLDREAVRERREAARAQRAERRDAAADVLTEDQRDLVFLHAAIAGGRGERGARLGRGRHGGPGGGRGGF